MRFISLNLNFSTPIGRIWLTFRKTLRRVHDPSYLKLSAAEFFFGELLAKRNSILWFFRRQRQCFRVKFFQKARKCWCFCKILRNTFPLSGSLYYFRSNFLSASFCQQTSSNLFLWNILWHTACPLRFLTLMPIFYKHNSRVRFLIAHLELKGHNWPGQKFLTAGIISPEILAKTMENLGLSGNPAVPY